MLNKSLVSPESLKYQVTEKRRRVQETVAALAHSESGRFTSHPFKVHDQDTDKESKQPDSATLKNTVKGRPELGICHELGVGQIL